MSFGPVRTIVVSSVVLIGLPALADGPAVSATNGYAEAGYQVIESDIDAKYVAGVLAMPVGDPFGAQLDGLYADIEGFDLWAVGGHLFRRDPEVGLVGPTGYWFEVEGFHAWAYGLEAEAYLGDVTLGGLLLRDDGDFGSSTSLSLSLGWYPVDDVALWLGGDYSSDGRGLTFDAEWQPGVPAPGLVLFAQALRGSDDFDAYLVGLRWHFGADKTLKARQREDDPRPAKKIAQSDVPDNMLSLLTALRGATAPLPR